MRLMYFAIGRMADLLRRNLKRDSRLWIALKKIRDGAVVFRDNPISRMRWKSNHEKFENLIEDRSKRTQGFFVLQIGACDGIVSDPIHKLIKKHAWQGVLVEPQKNEFERLKLNYAGCPGLRFENAAIADSDGLRPLFKMKEEAIEADWQRSIASLIPKPYLEQQDMLSVEMVACITFRTLLSHYGVERIDLLQIDVEGYDYELIKLFDFQAVKPRLIRYEHRHLSLLDRSSCKRHLKNMGYEILVMEHDTGAMLRRE
jgi:FkbM family methyltransferase